MEKFKMKKLEVKDGRLIAKFLVKTGLKKTLFEIMFPQDNPNLPKNWVELRKHLQEKHGMSDEAFREYQKKMEGDFAKALQEYSSDFPSAQSAIGEKIVEVVLDLFAEDDKYKALVDFAATMFEVTADEIENLPFPELIALVRQMLSESGFLALLQPSEPVTPSTEETLQA